MLAARPEVGESVLPQRLQDGGHHRAGRWSGRTKKKTKTPIKSLSFGRTRYNERGRSDLLHRIARDKVIAGADIVSDEKQD